MIALFNGFVIWFNDDMVMILITFVVISGSFDFDSDSLLSNRFKTNIKIHFNCADLIDLF